MAYEDIRVGQLSLRLIIKEITEASEQQGYDRLRQTHYRSEALFGRTARLIAVGCHPLYPRVIGYTELAMPFFMSKPRSQILDAPFACGDVTWDRWNKASLRKYIHVVVRVARCVISPEFRGLGLGSTLLKHAIDFARDRWQVSGLKPLFIEMSADMLKYVPFAVKAGMRYIGDTEGNVGRVAEDLQYLITNAKRVTGGEIVKQDSCGIVDKQVSRMHKALSLIQSHGWDVPTLIDKLQRYSAKPTLREYGLLYELLSLPKPTYMAGLVPGASEFLDRRIELLGIKDNTPTVGLSIRPVTGPIQLNNVGVDYTSRVHRSAATTAVQEAFGISPSQFNHNVVSDLSLSFAPGDVILVTGPSGSGKTSLLRALTSDTPVRSGAITLPRDYRPAVFKTTSSKKPLIDMLAANDVQLALHLLGTVGLSDAFVYFKRFSELSNGQQYRAMLASLLLNGANVWIADEFCASLDPLTAVAVAHRLQRVARNTGAILIVASSQPEPFVKALSPSKVVRLSTGVGHEVLDGGAFCSSLRNHGVHYGPPFLAITADYMKRIRAGEKSATIRRGRHVLDEDWLILGAGLDRELVRVTQCDVKRFEHLTDTDARRDGFETVQALHAALAKHYPGVKPGCVFTVVSFSSLLRSVVGGKATCRG